MQITRQQNESTADFVARAFRINRAQLCDCNQGRLPCRCSKFTAAPMPRDAKFDRYPGLRGATRTPAMSRRRAIWYASGLVAAVCMIAVAVLGYAG